MAIQGNTLTAVSAIADGDALPVWSASDGDWRRVSASALSEYVLADQSPGMVTQYSAPSATGFSVSVGDGDIWLIITPGGSYAAGTIVMPAVAGVTDGQELLCNCTQSVATLTVSGNGATVTGAPSSLSANGFFRLRFDAVASVWYRVG